MIVWQSVSWARDCVVLILIHEGIVTAVFACTELHHLNATFWSRGTFFRLTLADTLQTAKQESITYSTVDKLSICRTVSLSACLYEGVPLGPKRCIVMALKSMLSQFACESTLNLYMTGSGSRVIPEQYHSVVSLLAVNEYIC